MTKKELIILLKELKENQAKIELKKRELLLRTIKVEKIKIKIDTSITPSYEINGDIQSKNSISDKVGNFIANSFDRTEKNIKKLEKEIAELKRDIEALEERKDEAEIRLNGLYYKERQIIEAYYVENRTSEDIAYNLYLDLFGRTCSERYIRKMINEALEKMLKF